MKSVLSFRPFFLLAALLLAALSARGEIAVNVTYLDPAGEGFFDTSPRAAVSGNAGTTLGAQRRNAFEAAVYHWSKMLNGSVTLRIRATWVSQGEGTLASATPLGFVSDWSGVPVAGRYYPIALANQLAGLDHDPTKDDIQVLCNPDWDNGVNSGLGDARKWYYGTDGAASGGDFDYYSTMLHELGHGFGFLSFLSTDGSWVNGAPTIYDHFMANSSGTWVSSLSQSQRAAIVTSANLFSAGTRTTSANYDQWAKLHAPATHVPGSSLSHLDESTYSSNGHIDECMTPVSTFATHNIGPVATGLFRDMGYNFVDSQAPSVTISLPANGSSRSSLSLAAGTGTDSSSSGEEGSSGLREVRVTLWRQAGGNWYNWVTDTWGSTTYDANVHIKKASASIIPIGKGTRSWAIPLPTLADGNYEIQVQAVDQMNLGSAWVKSSFIMDRSAPGISFDPLQANDVVFNFSQLGGLANDADTVTYAIRDITDATQRFWNGASWVTTGEVYLPGSVSGGRWTPANPAQLPPRSQLRLGTYRLYAKARDGAGNETVSTIQVTRSAADTTLPDVAIVAPQTNQIFTTRLLPTLSGLASDPESGVEDVSVYLLRFAESGILYWDGAVWSSVSTSLPVLFDEVSGSWQSTGALPSGTDLPNGTYQVQVTVQNGENPPAVRGTGVNFIVDYHPTYTWTEGSYTDGVANNNNQNFDNPANWNPYGVPTPDAIIVIQKGQCFGPTNATVSVYGLNLGNAATFTAPALFVKKLNLSSGTLGGGTVHLDGDGGVFNWTGGQVNGTLAIIEGGVANITGNSTKTLGYGAVLDNWGTVNWSGSGSIYNLAYNLVDRATINNRAGGVFHVANDGSVFSSSYNASFFNNFTGARFIKTGGSGSTFANDYNFTNNGEVRVESGTLVFNGILNGGDGSAFTGSGQILIQSGTFNFGGEVLVDGASLRQSGGSLVGATDLVLRTVNGGSFEWSAGSISGGFELAQNSVLNITSSSTKSLGLDTLFKNRGTVNWSGSGGIYAIAYNASDRATFRNMPGATFNISGAARFEYSYNPSLFINDAGATVAKISGGASAFDWVFNNSGTVHCGSGSLSLNSGGSEGGSYFANSGAIIRFGGGAHSFANATAWKGAGTFEIASATVTLNGTLQLGSDDTSTSLELLSGNLNGQGVLTGRAAMKWTGGYLGGQLDFGTNLTVNISGSGSKTFENRTVINNAGVFNWDGTGELYAAPYELTNRVVFNNLSNAVFNIQSNATFSASYNASIFNNHPGGTVIKTSGAGTTTFNWDFNSLGTVRCSSGTVTLASNGDSGGSFIADADGIIRFAGGTHTLTNNTVMTGAGKIQVVSATVTHNGDIQTGTVGTPATIEILPGGNFRGSGSLIGVAAVNWTGGAVGPGILNVPSTVTFNVSGPSEKSFGAPTIFNNAGQFNLSGSGAIYCAAYEATNRSVFNNLSGGNFNIAKDGQVFSVSYNSSFFTNHAGGLVVKSDGAGTAFLNAFDIVNAGEFRIETGTVLFNGNLDLQHQSIFSGTGDVEFAGAVTLSGTLNSSSAVTLEAGSLVGLTNSPFVPTFAGTGSYGWTGGSISGALNIDSGVGFTVSGSSEKSIGRQTVFNNDGTVHWNSTGNLYVAAFGTGETRAFVRNRIGATWNWTTDADLVYSYVPSVFINENGATFRKTGSTGIANCTWDFNNEGTLEISSGNLALDGAVTIAPSAATRLSLGGTTAVTGYSQLVRSGALPIAGSLQVVFKDDFIPNNGAAFTLVTYSSHAGAFAPVVLPTLPSLSTWNLVYEANGLVARVIPVTSIQNVAKLVNGEFQFTANGEAGSSLVVEASSDLVTWQPISTNSPFNGVLTVIDSAASGFEKRFYRILILK